MGACVCNSNSNKKEINAKRRELRQETDNITDRNQKIEMGRNSVMDKEVDKFTGTNPDNRRIININFKYQEHLSETIKFDFDKDSINSQRNLILNSLGLNIASDYSFHCNEENLNIDQNAIFLTIFPNYFISKVKEIQNLTVEIKYLGMNIPNTRIDIIKAYNQFTLLGNLSIDDHISTINVYNWQHCTITSHFIDKDYYSEIKHFSNNSAICNYRNFLYLSGGMGNSKIALNRVLQINLWNSEIKEINTLTIPRYHHSMILVPNDYLFIIGGWETNVVEVFNINANNQTEPCSITKENHCEPTLCLVNQNYLYIFCGYKNENNSLVYSNCIEKSNLRLNERQWERVEFTLGKESTTKDLELDKRLFSVAYCDDQRILLLGGSKINFKKQENIGFYYNFNTDNIEIAYISCQQERNLEKFLLPLSEEASIGLCQEDCNANWDNNIIKYNKNTNIVEIINTS